MQKNTVPWSRWATSYDEAVPDRGDEPAVYGCQVEGIIWYSRASFPY